MHRASLRLCVPCAIRASPSIPIRTIKVFFVSCRSYEAILLDAHSPFSGVNSRSSGLQLQTCALRYDPAPFDTVRKLRPLTVFLSSAETLKVPVVKLEGDDELEIIELDPEVFGQPIRRGEETHRSGRRSFPQSTSDDRILLSLSFPEPQIHFIPFFIGFVTFFAATDVIHQVAVWHAANRRKGNSSSKTRGEVRGSTRKLFKQKGTGRARQGDVKSPVRRGGGKAHGPKPRDWSYSMPKKVRRLAMKCVLSGKLLEGSLTIVDNLALSDPKTKVLYARLEELGLLNALFVDGEEFHEAPEFLMASKNIPWVQLVSGLRANTLDILRRENLVLTKRAVAHLEDRLNVW